MAIATATQKHEQPQSFAALSAGCICRHGTALMCSASAATAATKPRRAWRQTARYQASKRRTGISNRVRTTTMVRPGMMRREEVPGDGAAAAGWAPAAAASLAALPVQLSSASSASIDGSPSAAASAHKQPQL